MKFLANFSFYFKLILPFAAYFACCFYNNNTWLITTGWLLYLIYFVILFNLKTSVLFKNNSAKNILLGFLGSIYLLLFNIYSANGFTNFLIENTFLELSSFIVAIIILSVKYSSKIKNLNNSALGLLLLTLFVLAFNYGLLKTWLSINVNEISDIHIASLVVAFFQISYYNIIILNDVLSNNANYNNPVSEKILLLVGVIALWFITPVITRVIKNFI